jgi:hypothetical protein
LHTRWIFLNNCKTYSQPLDNGKGRLHVPPGPWTKQIGDFQLFHLDEHRMFT